jgi:hypothetical protein
MVSNDRVRQWWIGGVAVVGVFVGPPAAKAVFQVFTAVGEITSVTSGSELDSDLDVGDPFVAVAIYDDALLTGLGAESITLDPTVHSGHSFDLTIGDPAVLTFDETDDVEFGGGTFPTINFNNGIFEAFSFRSEVFQINTVDFTAQLERGLRIIDDETGVTEVLGEVRETSQAPLSPD